MSSSTYPARHLSKRERLVIYSARNNAFETPCSGFPSLFPPNHTHFFLQNNRSFLFLGRTWSFFSILFPCYRSFLYLEVDCFFPPFFRFICSVSSLRSTLFLQVTLQSWPSLLLFACTCSLSAKLRDLVALTFACDGMSTKRIVCTHERKEG